MHNPVRPPSPSPAESFPALLARIRNLASRPARAAQGAFFIEGLRSFIQAHDAHFHFQSIVLAPILLKGDLADMLARRLHGMGVPRARVSPEQFRALSGAARASGIGAILRQRWMPLAKPPFKGLCHLVIEHIRSGGNLGTILRTAEATGVASVIFVGNHSDPYDPAAVRASMGGLFHIPMTRVTHAELAAWSRRYAVQLVALSPGADRFWTDPPRPTPQSPVALVVGEERRGISPQLACALLDRLAASHDRERHSLNVAVATGVMLYELVRRSILAGKITSTPTPPGGPRPRIPA